MPGSWPLHNRSNRVMATIFLVMAVTMSYAQEDPNQTVTETANPVRKYDSFYDTLKVRAQNKKFTRLIYRYIFTKPKSAALKYDSLNSLNAHEGKYIRDIKIIRLDVFGPSVRDTSGKATLWYEKAGNLIHTRSDLHNIRKNLVFKKGDRLNAEEIYENERLLRALPYVRDAKFLVRADSLLPGLADVILLIQDRFSIGVTGDVNGFNSAALEMYNRNIFGVGHEISMRLVGHVNKKPYMGFESFYRINNVSGKFISFSAGYSDTYLTEGGMISFSKDFLRITDAWGYGAYGYSFKRNYKLPADHNAMYPYPIGYEMAGAWGGHTFSLGNGYKGSQLTFSGQYIYRHFNNRPLPQSDGGQFFSHSNFYLAGITWSKRSFIPDELIYGYGITEDIPKGFKNEWVVGFDDNENGKRYYSHLYISNGNLIRRKPGYWHFSTGLGGYLLPDGKWEQGLAEISSNYISRLLSYKQMRFRQFVTFNYVLGVNRFEPEILRFEKNNLIRGFESREVEGRQRLNINLETVYFQSRNFYRFNMAFFTFADLGIIGPPDRSIFRCNYYTGLGIGLRLHNESLAFKTLQVRLAFYPNHPKDVGIVGFLLNEHTRQTFYSFQPGPPSPRRFE